MKLGHTAIFMTLFCTLMLFHCKKQPTLPQLKSAAVQIPHYDANGSRVDSDSMHCDSLFPVLLRMQDEVYLHPQSNAGIGALLKVSFDSTSGCFLTIGKGVHNPAMPEASWKQGRKIASGYDAKRWAMYMKLWSQGVFAPFGRKISGEISYSKVVLEKIENDTLYTLVSTPFGSIILKE